MVEECLFVNTCLPQGCKENFGRDGKYLQNWNCMGNVWVCKECMNMHFSVVEYETLVG